MFGGIFRLLAVLLSAAVFTVLPALVSAQENGGAPRSVRLPGVNGFAPGNGDAPLALGNIGEITLSAKLIDDGADIGRGLIWRIFKPDAGPDGKLPLIASAQGGTTLFQLEPGSYLVHASFGRAGATKRITIGREKKQESVVLDAGGLELDAVLAGGAPISPDKLRFSIYDGEPEADGERGLILPDVSPNTVIRLNSGTYHIVSTYGTVNAVIRSDIRVEAGKLTQATVEHLAAEVTMKLVRETGGEAMADTSWSILSQSGDPIREIVGAYASLVLAEGDYTIVAKNRDRIYQKDFKVVGGQNQEVEVLANEANSVDAIEGAD